MSEGNGKWFELWNKRAMDAQSSDSLLGKLIKVDGFDHPEVGDYNEEEWIKLCSHFGRVIGLKENDKVLELGCGAGAFLLSLQKEFLCEIFGIDYSESVIEIARNNLNGTFITSDASQVSKMNEAFDLIFLHSVMQYFPSLDYTCKVIEEAYLNLADDGKIGLLDVNDKAKEDIYHSSRRLKYKDPKEYDLLYSDHPHNFFSKKVISKILTEAGFKNISFYPHVIDTYGNSELRFNVIAEK